MNDKIFFFWFITQLQATRRKQGLHNYNNCALVM
jgi:hypothetical protein